MSTLTLIPSTDVRLTMNRARVFAFALLPVMLLIAACGSEPDQPPRSLPAKSFTLQTHSERVFQAYRKTGEVKKVAAVSLSTKNFAVQVDCVGSHGKIDIKVGTTGSVGTCSTKSGLGKARILWILHEKFPKRVTVVVTTDPRNTWSVAVDAGTHASN